MNNASVPFFQKVREGSDAPTALSCSVICGVIAPSLVKTMNLLTCTTAKIQTRKDFFHEKLIVDSSH